MKGINAPTNAPVPDGVTPEDNSFFHAEMDTLFGIPGTAGVKREIEALLTKEGLGEDAIGYGEELTMPPHEIRNMADTQVSFSDGTSPEFIVEADQDFLDGMVKGTL